MEDEHAHERPMRTFTPTNANIKVVGLVIFIFLAILFRNLQGSEETQFPRYQISKLNATKFQYEKCGFDGCVGAPEQIGECKFNIHFEGDAVQYHFCDFNNVDARASQVEISLFKNLTNTLKVDFFPLHEIEKCLNTGYQPSGNSIMAGPNAGNYFDTISSHNTLNNFPPKYPGVYAFRIQYNGRLGDLQSSDTGTIATVTLTL